MGPKARLALKIGGFVVLALVSFVLFLQLTFPYHRVRDKVIEVLSSSYDVTVGGVKRGLLPGKFTMTGVMLKGKPGANDKVPPPAVFIDELTIDAGVFAAISGNASIDIEAKIGGGTVTGNVTVPMKRGGTLDIDLALAGVNGEVIGQVREALGLPLVGKLDGVVRLSLPSDARNASGKISLACNKGCTLGDGESKFLPKITNTRSAAMMQDGIEFGKINIVRFATQVDIKDGKLDVSKWEFDSPDGKVELDFHMKLGKRFKDSDIVRGCLKFKGTPELEKRDQKTFGALQMSGAVLGPDDLLHIKLEGKFGTMKRRPKVCTEGEVEGSDDVNPTAGAGERRSGRPALSPTVEPAGAKPGDTGSKPSESPPPSTGPNDPTLDTATPTPAAAPSGVIDAAPAMQAPPPGTPPPSVLPANGDAVEVPKSDPPPLPPPTEAGDNPTPVPAPEGQ